MDARQHWQRSVVEDFEHMARVQLGLDDPVSPEWQFGGFHYSYELVLDTYRAYKAHGILPVTGGYFDQPYGWWEDMRTCEALLNTRLNENQAEYEEKMRKPRG